MIRKYRTEDIDAVVSVWWAASALTHPFLAEAFLAQEAENLRNIYLANAETWVLEKDGEPVGFIALVDDEIGGLFLHPSFHGRGLGRAMVDHAAGLRGALRVEVFQRNAIGRRFYERYGFVELETYRHEASGEMTTKMATPKS
jgi:putative acetyltransferase